MEMRMEAAGRKQGEEEEEVMERNRIGTACAGRCRRDAEENGRAGWRVIVLILCLTTCQSRQNSAI